MTSKSYSIGPKGKLNESKPNGCGQSLKHSQARIARSNGFLMGAPGTESGNGENIENSIAIESAEAAEEAGLYYVSDDRPGYTRQANSGSRASLQNQMQHDERTLLEVFSWQRSA